MAHGGLAFGLVAASLALGPRGAVTLDAYLFGDILTVTRADLLTIWGGAFGICLCIAWRWQALLTATLHPDLAFAAGLKPARDTLLLTALIALLVAIAIKIVGALLITALLIIPAAAARVMSRGPEAMVIVTFVIGVIAAKTGISASVVLDAPTGPSIICATSLIYALAQIYRLLRRE